MNDYLNIREITCLAQSIFPEIRGEAWSITESSESFTMGAIFSIWRRMEVTIKPNEWAICQVILRSNRADKTGIETLASRSTFIPTRTNFIGWFSLVRSTFTLPQDFLLIRETPIFEREPSLMGSKLTLTLDYTYASFSTDSNPTFETDPDVIRNLIAEGTLVPWSSNSDKCQGCALQWSGCHSNHKPDDCFLVDVPKPTTFKPNRVSCHRCKYSTGNKCRKNHVRGFPEKCPDYQENGRLICESCEHIQRHPNKTGTRDVILSCNKGFSPARYTCYAYEKFDVRSFHRPSCHHCFYVETTEECKTCKKGHSNRVALMCPDYKIRRPAK